ncbi:MAG: helix-turn-helix domain-containing protein [Candidatus Binatia bacterium]
MSQKDIAVPKKHDNETTGLGLRLRNTRRQRGMSLDTLAAKTSLTKSYLSKIERGEKAPSLASILKITRAFDIQVSHLFGEATDKDAICVVRRGERKPVARIGAKKGYKYEAIAYKRRSKCMEAFIMYPPRRFEDDTLFEHEGEELIFVLKGKVEVVLVDKKVVLGPGDTIYFDGCHLHRSRSLSKSAVTLVVVAREQAEHRRPL